LIKYIFYLGMLCSLTLMSCSSSQELSKQTNYPDIMKMEGSFEQVNQDEAIFKLVATRLKNIEGEYLPSSENFAIRVYNSEMKEIYNSSTNKNFFMVIGEVEPKLINTTKTYTYEWNIRDNNNKHLKSGKYQVQLIIPAKPNNYISNLEIEIK